MDTPTASTPSSPRRAGSSRIDAAMAARVEAARRELPESPPGSVQDIGDAAQSVAPAVSPWADALGRAGSRAGQIVLIAAVLVGLLWILFQVKVVVIDMCSPYRAAVQQTLPHARLVADRFHLVRLANAMVTEGVSDVLCKGCGPSLSP